MSKSLDKHLNSGSLRKAIFEHLKTRKKYNTLDVKYKVKCEELEDKTDECKLKDRLYTKRQETWDNTLKEQEEEIIDLKRKNTELKKEIRELKKQVKKSDKNEKEKN